MSIQKKATPEHSYQSVDKNRIKYVIAVASGKGGVGKSTVTVNLALILQSMGYSAGVLDADVYGPSIGKMLGVKVGEKPQIKDVNGQAYYKPIEAHGLQVMSMAFLTGARTPMIWRGPMASKALQQMLLQTWWKDLDILLVDMPPGTGDIQLTLSQRTTLSGAVIVTTPQNIALLDAERGIEMFRKVNVPVLGIIENMSGHTCSECGHTEYIFGEQGGVKLSKDYQVPFLGTLPLSLNIRQQADDGYPTVIAEPAGSVTDSYKSIAQAMINQVQSSKIKIPDIEIGS